MAVTYHVRAVVLKREPWRETARLYTFYTREHGKVLAVGRGTRKLLSKLAAHLEPYSSVDLHLARGRRIETVCGATMTRTPEPLASDEARHLAAAFVAEAADHFIKPGERDGELWDLLDGVYADLSAVPADRLGDRLTAFVWEFMSHLGYRPKFGECAECGRAVGDEVVRFLPVSGTVACRTCPLPERELAGAVLMAPAAPTSEGALSFLEARLDRPLTTLPPVRARLGKTVGAPADEMVY